jgi:hypothetical protein
MAQKKTDKQRRQELERRKTMLKKISPVDTVKIGKSTDRGVKW